MTEKFSERVVEACEAMGVRPGEHGYGRPFEAEVFPLLRDDDGEGCVRLKVSKPLLVFCLSIEQSIALARELVATAQEAKRWQEQARGAAT